MLNLLIQGNWIADQVKATTVESSRPAIPEVERVIGETWEEQKAVLGDLLFDGPMCRLETFPERGIELHLEVSETSYRTFLGTNLRHADLAEKFGRSALANAIGMSVALFTADQKLVMGRRNNRVAYYPDYIHPFAGALEPRDVPQIFTGIGRELEEELHISDAEVADLRMLAVVEDRRLLQPEFIFAARTARTAAELRGSLDQAEHQSLWLCDASPEPLGILLDKIDLRGSCGADLFTPIAVGALVLFGQWLHGLGWSHPYMHKFFTS